MPTPIPQQPIGIDVSHHQGFIDWAKVAASGRSFAYIKSTQGTGFVDPRYKRNIVESKRNGIIPGAYHFLSHGPGLTGAKQAQHFLDIVGPPEGGYLPYALDIEVDPEYPSSALSLSQMTNRVTDFVRYIYLHTGVYPVIYGDRWFLAHELSTGWLATVCPLWLAHWGTDTPQVVGGWAYHTFHQFEARPGYPAARVPGVAGTCDVDRFNGSMQRLRVLANME